jgi:hypothetical protein
MGVSFDMQVVRATPEGAVAHVEGEKTHFWVKSSVLFDLLDAGPDKKFPWYHRSFGWNGNRKRPPVPADCYRPKDVLESLQWLERELQKNSSRYPKEWTFHVPQPDGSVAKLSGLKAMYRNKACRLFGDDRGCWAVETDSPMAFPVHYELTDLPEVTVRLEPEAGEIAVRITSRSYLTVQGPLIQQIKEVCLRAMQENALLLTSIE